MAIYIDIKKEYDGFDLEGLTNNIYNKLLNLQEKHIASICDFCDTSIDEIKRLLESLELKENLFPLLIEILSKNYSISMKSNINYLLLGLRYALNKPDLTPVDLLFFYHHLLITVRGCDNIFIKFCDRTYFTKTDFDKVLSTAYEKLVTLLGKEKVDNILSDLEKTNIEPQEKIGIIESHLEKKKSIEEEIEDVKRKKANTKESDPLYKQLTLRLNKLISYKEHFNTEKVISGEGIFDGYYGFDFDGVYVFDYFIEGDNDIEDKAREESEKGCYILTFEDYLKVKSLKNRLAAKQYINAHIKPFGETANHGDNFNRNMLEKLASVKKHLAERKLFYGIADTDNPVTEVEVKLTQEKVDYYTKRLLPKDFEELEHIAEKTTSRKLKSSINKIIGVQKVEKEISEEEKISDLNDEQKNKLNNDISKMLEYLDAVNIERRNCGMKELSFDKDNFIEVYLEISDYKKRHHINEKTSRDPQVAYKTKQRTFYDGCYHCELCGEKEMEPIYVESHHFIPISTGGPDNIYNTVCLCKRCHTSIHNGRVTDEQNFKLIKAIKTHIQNEDSELLPLFEKTLGFKYNYYIEKIEELETEIAKIKNSMLLTISENGNDEEILKKIEELEKETLSLEEKKTKMFELANRLQDYYVYDSYHEDNKKTK